MKTKKVAAIISAMLIIGMTMTMFAGAVGKSVSVKSNAATYLTEKQQIRSLYNDILSLKKQCRQAVATIKVDLAGTKGVDSITSSQDYIDVTTTLQTVKGELTNAEKENYQYLLAKAKSGVDVQASYDSAISTLTAKKSLLTQAVNDLNTALTKAENIKQQKQQLISDWNSFKTQADAKKKTIDASHTTIASINDSNETVMNQIVATVSANKDVLASQGAALASIESKLTDIKNSLKDEYNGKVVTATQSYNNYRKNRDYTNALAELDTIITIQQNRVNVVTQAQKDLQSVLSDLNSLVASAASTTSAA